MFRSASARLAAAYTGAFAASVVALGVVALLTTRAALGRQFEGRVLSESRSLEREYRAEGLAGVVQAVRERDATPGALDYGLRDPRGAALAGRLAAVRAPLGWSMIDVRERGDEPERTRLYATALPGGYRLLVGDDADRASAVDGVLIASFSLAFLGVVALGVAGGYGLSRDVNRRIAALAGAAQAIIDGDLTRRAPARGGTDELDRLAVTLNRMLDRISVLLESLRQVSNDIAHDLRTPLTRLRQRLETAQAGADGADRTEAIEGALGDLDAILATFAALLRIAQIEGGERRAGFRAVDLAAAARTVVEAFAPSAEDAGGSLRLEADAPASVEGDPELLTQMLVNLVENALRHAGPSPTVRVRCAPTAGSGAVLSVIDDGPGVPLADRTRLFDRFQRLEASRSTPGSGLGLALVAAVARLHGAEVSLHDASPGLEARVTFPG
ncbi:MAG: HAMP domain-containing sensor histidine kinase [Pseudomonadota bacterium]